MLGLERDGKVSDTGMWAGYCAPCSVREALCLLSEHGPKARIIAGGTDLLVELRRGAHPGLVLVDVSRIGGLDRVYVDDADLIHVGPCVTHNRAVASDLLRERARPLALACWQVGTPPLRNRGTIAGNLVTASPANDSITALWALDARLTLCSLRGKRVVNLADFYRGVRQTRLAPDEMVTDVVFPGMSSNQRGVFLKLGLRRTHAIAVVNVAVVLSMDGDRVARARITLGSVAPTIVRAAEAEDALLGRTLEDDSIAQAARLAARAAVPIDDIRSGADYRRQGVQVLARRALVALRDREDPSLGLTVAQVELPADPPMLWGKTNGRFAPLTRCAVWTMEAVFRSRSTSCQRSPKASPRRQPV